ncbi:MAG: hypothetical protein LC808_05395 [Actinobacteria bacterium]|nr:hypothetical protein [Actinomycetota bacterium]
MLSSVTYDEVAMPTITITIEVPDRADVDVQQRSSEEAAVSPAAHYWEHYLSENGRRVYHAAAEIEMNSGVGYTLEEIAEHMGVAYGSAQSMHRSTGRTAKRWRRDHGTNEPIYLDDMGYGWHQDRQGWRNSYRLPHHVAEQILTF